MAKNKEQEDTCVSKTEDEKEPIEGAKRTYRELVHLGNGMISTKQIEKRKKKQQRKLEKAARRAAKKKTAKRSTAKRKTAKKKTARRR